MRRPVPASSGEIFFRCLDRIDQVIVSGKHARACRDDDFAIKLRTELFKLEGWAKLHRHWPNQDERPVFAKLRATAKELEDALGAMTLTSEIARVLEEHKHEAVALRFDQEHESTFLAVKKVLKKRDWFGSRLKKMRSSLAKVEWPSPSEQYRWMLDALHEECVHLEVRYNEEFKTDLLKDHYTRKILETKFHKFRRQLRWISMYFQVGEGLIAFQPLPKKLSTEDRKLVKDYKENPFSKLEPARSRAAAHIDPLAFYELNRLTDILGEAKDPAERYFQVREAIDDADEARANFGDAPHEVPKQAHVIMKEYERKKPLRALATGLAEHR